jgi:hypothetical protein
MLAERILDRDVFVSAIELCVISLAQPYGACATPHATDHKEKARLAPGSF